MALLTCDGSSRICGTQGIYQLALVFGPGDHMTATTQNEQGLRFLLVAGQPIGEPVVQYGPFVMNTQVKSWYYLAHVAEHPNCFCQLCHLYG